MGPVERPASSGGAQVSAEYRFSTSITEADPGNGRFRMDNVTPASVTELFISSITDNNNDFDNILSFLSSGDQIYIQQDNDATKFILFDVTANVDNTGWWSIAGTIASSGALFDNNGKCHILILFGGTGPGGGGGGDVFKVGTPVDGEIGVWTGDGTIEGDPHFTWNTATGLMSIGSNASPGLGASQLVAILIKQADGVQLGAFGFANSADFSIISNNHGGNMILGGEDAGGVPITYFTLDPDTLRIRAEVPIYIVEQAARGLSFSTQGQFWVRDDVPNVPMFTSNFDFDFELIGSDGSGASSRIPFFTGPHLVAGSANFTYAGGGNPEQMMIQVVQEGNLNEVGLLIIDSNSVLNPDGYGIMPGQAGLFDGSLIFTDDPTDTINNRNMTMVKNNSVAFGKGAAVAANVSFRSEAAGALAFFMPQDTTGREETKISFVGEVGGTGHEGVFSIEGFAYGNSGLQFHRLFQCVIDADYTLHMDAYGRITVGNVTGAAAPVVAGDNASMGYSVANGLELTGQGSTNDVTIFNDTHTPVIEIPTGTLRANFAGTVALVAGHLNLPNYTDAELDDITDAVNTSADKVAGSMVFNSTQGHAVTAQGAADGSVWNDGVGTTTNTPV